MGSTRWSSDIYTTRTTLRAKSGKDAFDYHREAVSTGRVKTHEKLEPKTADGCVMRESRDSDANPESLAIIVNMDVTGSMRTLPKIMVEKLGTLMGLLIKKGYVRYPHIMFSANGDGSFLPMSVLTTTDKCAVQVGQFESSIEMDDDLSRLLLEGGGGDGRRESYELMMYFYSHHTSIDCFEKRGKKGYLFFIGDEMPYPNVKKEEVSYWLGESIQSDIPIETIVEELCKKYDVFVIIPNGSANFTNPEMRDSWKNLFGQRVIILDDINQVAETIVATIGVNEGFDLSSVSEEVKKETGKALTKSVETSLIAMSKTSNKVVKVENLPNSKPSITKL